MQGDLTIRNAATADAAWFASRLRKADADEIAAHLGDNADVAWAIATAIAAPGLAYVAEHEGRGVLLLGCVDAGDHGIPWLVGTDEAVKFPKALTAVGAEYTARFLERWPRLRNFVDARNTVSVRWLKRLGYTIHEAVPYGFEGAPFRSFSMGA